jgi:putative ABC transport system substrate-binding protein
MNKKVPSLALCALLLALCLPAQAQQAAKKFPRIGYLSASSSSVNPTRIEAFRHGLRELGYVEGKNIVVEWRYADGKLHRLRELAAELVSLKADVIVTGGSQATGPAKEATSTIPIVMAQDNDPLGQGFIATLARPGGNITGLSTHYPEISGKQLEILKEIVPGLARVAVLRNSTVPGIAQTLRETEAAATATGVQLQYIEVQGLEDINTAFRPQSKGALTRSSCCPTPGSTLIERRLWRSLGKVVFR